MLVARFSDRLKYDELSNFFTTPIDWVKIKKHCPRFIALFSDNDPYVPIANAEVFKKNLGAEVSILSQHGHFSGPGDNCTKLQEALTASLNLTT